MSAPPFAHRSIATVAALLVALCALFGGPRAATAQMQPAVEYYYAAWNFYFVTSFPAEIAALDGGAFGGAWQRTGQTFLVWSQAVPGTSPTCRFFSTPTAFGGKSSHFYTPFPAECQDLQTNPALSAVWQLETPAAFYLALTDASGNCPAGTVPLYRAYNNGMGGAPNHRYTTDPAIQLQMTSMGWVAEGNGPHVVFACVPAQNVVPISVDGGPDGITNIPFISITICAPGSSTNCQTIDHIEVDTMSYGLRLLSSVLSPSLALPQQFDANGNPLVECAQFADGFSWGPVKAADMYVAGEQAKSLAVQVIGDPAFPLIPLSCSNSGPPENTVSTFGANGMLGVGSMLQDCGIACAQFAIPGWYYSCPAFGCSPAVLGVSEQLQNPVAQFGADNNGVIVSLLSIPAQGAATGAGSLIFGIGTQSNNALGTATVLSTDPNTGNIAATLFNNQSFDNSFIDSGSNGLFIGTDLYPICTGSGAGWYCPVTAQNLVATLQGTNGNASVVAFSIGNYDQLGDANPTFNAFNNIAAPADDPSTFVWGLNFFYGRSVYTAIEQRNTPGGMGPYVAF